MFIMHRSMKPYAAYGQALLAGQLTFRLQHRPIASPSQRTRPMPAFFTAFSVAALALALPQAVIETSHGAIVVELDEAAAPLSVANFIVRAQAGISMTDLSIAQSATITSAKAWLR
ncbi:MAG: hypothetical protein JKP95_02910 [Oceanicaulis sp.]|nr:hypothetical protein [Oceanicaulis sp.]